METDMATETERDTETEMETETQMETETERGMETEGDGDEDGGRWKRRWRSKMKHAVTNTQVHSCVKWLEPTS